MPRGFQVKLADHWAKENERKKNWLSVWLTEWINEWVNGWMNEWTNGRTEGRTDGRTNERTNERMKCADNNGRIHRICWLQRTLRQQLKQRRWRPWVSRHQSLMRMKMKLLQSQTHRLRLVCQHNLFCNSSSRSSDGCRPITTRAP